MGDDGFNRSVLVVGLGRFGCSVAQTLQSLDQDVLAVDKDPLLVARWASTVPTVEADVTDPIAVEQLGASDFDAAVVAIGDSVEASVLVTGNLLDAGISDVWAKSVSNEHARILQRIGARHIVNAETDAGKRVGHLVTGQFLDYIEIEGEYTVVKIHTPPQVAGKTIAEAQVHDKYGVTVIGVNVPGHEFQHGTNDTMMPLGAELVLLGTQNQIDKFING
ncbi:KtrA [Bifidobacterium margollesii]|uniref:KtrA n=1 Tax=Bifidobacterium margollesii TaxID=2020964 RepID=A0A2N5J8L5_9BIFI|nr:TrkA family potassium uptake protein [Bifidobacterium margollesii]PLS30556.1 KtrA [Bifidobacterium margollesii]